MKKLLKDLLQKTEVRKREKKMIKQHRAYIAQTKKEGITND